MANYIKSQNTNGTADDSITLTPMLKHELTRNTEATYGIRGGTLQVKKEIKRYQQQPQQSVKIPRVTGSAFSDTDKNGFSLIDT